MKRKMLVMAAAATLTLGLGATSANAAPTGRPATAPDVACMQAGIAALKGAGVLSTVAKNGLPISVAVAPPFNVTVRPGADISGVPNPIPFSVVLADHRAGDNSLFVYPWCS